MIGFMVVGVVRQKKCLFLCLGKLLIKGQKAFQLNHGRKGEKRHMCQGL